jgi:hypothetical protein
MVVMNIGGFPFTTGPVEATYVVNELVKPNSVIASHVSSFAVMEPGVFGVMEPVSGAGNGHPGGG